MISITRHTPTYLLDQRYKESFPTRDLARCRERSCGVWERRPFRDSNELEQGRGDLGQAEHWL